MGIQGKPTTLDEVVEIPNWDTNNLTLDQLKIMT